MPGNLIKSKITSPRLHDKIVHRERLHRLLDENINKNLVIVCAPAGFGKTTLVLDYLSNRKARYAWFIVPHRGIEDVSVFFEYFINALRNVYDGFGSNTLEIMKSYLQRPNLFEEMIHVLTTAFINEFINIFKEDVIFVIDDMDYIYLDKSLRWQNELFNELLDNIPVNMHLIIISRSVPDFNLTPLKAKRNFFVIDESKLIFDRKETAQLIEEVYCYEFNTKDIELLEDNLKGWITGIHLLLEAYGEDFKRTKFSGNIASENIFDFFAHEIYENLNKELQEFLLVTSLVDNFSSAMCDRVLGIKTSNELIKAIIRKNLFIQQIRPFHEGDNESSPSYSYHSLLRNFLSIKLSEHKSEAEIKSLKIKIAEYYLSSADSISAIDYYLEAFEINKAVTLIINGFEKFYKGGRNSTLWRWLNSLPPQIIDENPYLMFIIARLYYFVNPDYTKSLSYINNGLKSLVLPKDEDLIIKCYDVKSTILFHTGKNKSAISELKRLLNAELKPENKISILCTLAEFYGMMGQHETALRLSNDAIALDSKFNLNKVNSRLYNVLALSNRFTGNLLNAQLYFEKALETADNLYSRILIISNIAIQQFESGRYNEAKSYIDKAYHYLGSSSAGYLLILVLKCNAYLELDIGNYERSIKLLEDAYRLSEKGNDLSRMNECVIGLFFCYFYLNDHERCIEYLNKGRLNANEYHKSVFNVCEAYLKDTGLNSSIEENLLNAYAYFHKNSDLVWVADASFCLANYFLQNDMVEKASNYVKIFLETGSKNQYLGLFQNYAVKLRQVFDFAFSHPELKEYKDFIKQLFSGVFDRLKLEWTSDEYKRKMRVEIDSLYDIKMISFGSLKFKSRGNTVPESKWRKKKGKSILAYMMLDPDARYSKDKLINIFFPNVNPDTADENFRQAIFNIRNVFKNPYLNILIYEEKMLSLNQDCYFKSDAVEFDINCRIVNSEEKSADERIRACKNIIELYKGEFLDGYYEPWCEDIRNEYANKFISVSETLIGLLKEKESYGEIAEFSENLLKHDPLNEQAYLGLINAFIKLGRKKSARAEYTRMLKTYENELGEKPNSEALRTIENLIQS
jgi:DNA-binding SARP family transcriptional activator/tetratricopeptide (TPR) repeat protein